MNVGKAVTTMTIAIAVLLAMGVGQGNAQTRITMRGASPMADPLNSIMGGLTPLEYAELGSHIGANWFPGTTVEPVDYPATAGVLWGVSAPTADQSIAIGQLNLDAAIMAAVGEGAPVVVAGLSMGTMSIDQELTFLATAPDAPLASQLSFTLFASPSRGIASLFAPGQRIPLLDYSAQSIVDSQYDINVVFTQYDVWSDFPDRPWNPFAVANAVIGLITRPELHTPTAFAASSDAILLSDTTNEKGATTKIYMIPTTELALTDPLRLLGAPKWLTDAIDSGLRPLVDAGYSRNDVGPVRRPYVSHGEIVGPELLPGNASSVNRLEQTAALSRSGVSETRLTAVESAGLRRLSLASRGGANKISPSQAARDARELSATRAHSPRANGRDAVSSGVG